MLSNVAKVGSKALGQQFNFAQNKAPIVRRITQSLKTGQKVDLEDTIYDTMRNGHGVEMVDKLGYTAADKSSYRTFIQNWPYGNTAWAQKNFGETFPIISGGRTYNYYATLVKDRQNIDKFIRSLPDLDQRLTQLSSQLKQPIRYKINSMLTALASENDNFKLFYYDPAIKPQVTAAVQLWLKDNGIQIGERSHTHGVDIKGQGSYGKIISQHVNDAIDNIIKQYGDKYTPEQYYTWLATNFNKLISQVKVK